MHLRPDQVPSGGEPALPNRLVGPILRSAQSSDIGQQSIPIPAGDKLQHNIKAEETPLLSVISEAVTARRSISPPPRYDVQHQSLCFFVNLFCFQAGRLYSFPVLDFLPEVLEKVNPSSCLYQAANAVSRLTLADRYSGKDVRLQTGREYGQALSLTNATIRDTSASIQDETLLAVWLLGLYEVSWRYALVLNLAHSR